MLPVLRFTRFIFLSVTPTVTPTPVCVAESGPREPRRHTFALGSPSLGFSLELRPQKHMSLIKCSLRHWLVNTQLQENQQRAHSSSATLWLWVCDSLFCNKVSLLLQRPSGKLRSSWRERWGPLFAFCLVVSFKCYCSWETLEKLMQKCLCL